MGFEPTTPTLARLCSRWRVSGYWRAAFLAEPPFKSSWLISFSLSSKNLDGLHADISSFDRAFEVGVKIDRLVVPLGKTLSAFRRLLSDPFCRTFDRRSERS